MTKHKDQGTKHPLFSRHTCELIKAIMTANREFELNNSADQGLDILLSSCARTEDRNVLLNTSAVKSTVQESALTLEGPQEQSNVSINGESNNY